jgi:hypothetical protein
VASQLELEGGPADKTHARDDRIWKEGLEGNTHFDGWRKGSRSKVEGKNRQLQGTQLVASQQ